VYAGLRG
jgi:Peptidase family S41.